MMRRYTQSSRNMLAVIVTFVLACSLVHAQTAQLISAVRVEGLESVSKEAVLDEVKTILKVGEAFDADKSAAARAAVMKMGYFEDVVLSTEQAQQGVVVVITVVEKMKVKKITFVGNTVIPDRKLEEAILTKVGHVRDDRAIHRDVRRIEDCYTEQGYLCHVTQAGVDDFGVLTFVIEEVRIESIEIVGLKRTKELVVRRELTVQPGELFQEKRITKNLSKIFDLGIFQDASYDVRPGKDDSRRTVIVVIKVVEKRTGQVSLSLGYSSLDKTVLVLGYSEGNLRGRAERTTVNLELFGRTSFDVSFMEPRLDKRGTSMEVNVFDTERRRRFVGGASVSANDDVFDERRSGATLRFTRPTTETESTSLQFRSEKVSSSYFQGTRTFGGNSATVAPAQTTTYDGQLPGHNQGQTRPPDSTDPSTGSAGPGEHLGPIVVAAPLHPGGRLTSFALGRTRDTRDSLHDPRSGSYTGGNFEWAGTFLGGSVDFRKLSLEHRRFFKMGKKDVFAMRLMGGVSQGDMPLFESFSAGGANSVRGYEEDRFRGERMVVLNTEYRHPITSALTAVGFVDVGDAFGGQFPTVVPGFSIPAEDHNFKAHAGAGVGLRVVTPFGPIRLDLGWGSEGSQVHFGFGQTF